MPARLWTALARCSNCSESSASVRTPAVRTAQAHPKTPGCSGSSYEVMDATNADHLLGCSFRRTQRTPHVDPETRDREGNPPTCRGLAAPTRFVRGAPIAIKRLVEKKRSGWNSKEPFRYTTKSVAFRFCVP